MRALKREVKFLKDKNESLTKGYDELKKEHEKLLLMKSGELNKLKLDLEAKLKKEVEKNESLKTKNEELWKSKEELQNMLREKDSLFKSYEDQKKDLGRQLKEKQKEIDALQGQIAKTNDESGDYRSIISGLKKKHALELSEKMKQAEKRLRE